jgi:hypothetical protein
MPEDDKKHVLVEVRSLPYETAKYCLIGEHSLLKPENSRYRKPFTGKNSNNSKIWNSNLIDDLINKKRCQKIINHTGTLAGILQMVADEWESKWYSGENVRQTIRVDWEAKPHWNEDFERWWRTLPDDVRNHAQDLITCKKRISDIEYKEKKRLANYGVLVHEGYKRKWQVPKLIKQWHEDVLHSHNTSRLSSVSYHLQTAMSFLCGIAGLLLMLLALGVLSLQENQIDFPGDSIVLVTLLLSIFLLMSSHIIWMARSLKHRYLFKWGTSGALLCLSLPFFLGHILCEFDGAFKFSFLASFTKDKMSHELFYSQLVGSVIVSLVITWILFHITYYRKWTKKWSLSVKVRRIGSSVSILCAVATGLFLNIATGVDDFSSWTIDSRWFLAAFSFFLVVSLFLSNLMIGPENTPKE